MYFVFPYHCRDSGSSWLRWNRPSRQPGNSWKTRTTGRSWQTGQPGASRGLWCFHVLSDLQPQGTLQQRTQRLMTQQRGRGCYCERRFLYDKVCVENSCTGGGNNLISWVKMKWAGWFMIMGFMNKEAGDLAYWDTRLAWLLYTLKVE